MLVAWILLTIPFAVDPGYSFDEWRKLVAQILLFYWASLVLARQDGAGTARNVFLAAVAGATLLSVVGLWYFFEEGGTLLNRRVRAMVPGSHSHWLATYLVMTIPVMLAVRCLMKPVWGGLVALCAIASALVAELYTFSRGGWLALAIQAVVFPFLTGRRTKAGPVVSVGVVVCVLVGLLLLGQAGYLGGIFESQTVVDRLTCWELGLAQILESPIIGSGYGTHTFGKIFHGEILGRCSGGHLHNTFLMVAMGSGLPALALFLWMLGKAGYELIRRREPRGQVMCPDPRVAVALMVLGFAVCNVFNRLNAGSLGYLFWLLLATGLWWPSASVPSARTRSEERAG